MAGAKRTLEEWPASHPIKCSRQEWNSVNPPAVPEAVETAHAFRDDTATFGNRMCMCWFINPQATKL